MRSPAGRPDVGTHIWHCPDQQCSPLMFHAACSKIRSQRSDITMDVLMYDHCTPLEMPFILWLSKNLFLLIKMEIYTRCKFNIWIGSHVAFTTLTWAAPNWCNFTFSEVHALKELMHITQGDKGVELYRVKMAAPQKKLHKSYNRKISRRSLLVFFGSATSLVLDEAPNCVNRNRGFDWWKHLCNYIQSSYLLWQDFCRQFYSSLPQCQVVGVARGETMTDRQLSAHLQGSLPPRTHSSSKNSDGYEIPVHLAQPNQPAAALTRFPQLKIFSFS